MAWSVDSARAKVRRVKDNLKALDDQLGAYIASDPHVIVSEFDAKSGWHSVQIEVAAPGPEFALIIGEAVHNLRSALDHIAWQLANLDGPPPRPKSVQWPIFSPGKKPKNFRSHHHMNGMRREHKTVLEGLQPDAAGANALFEWLAYLSNQDKHRLLHTTASLASEFDPHFLEPRAGYEIADSSFGYTGLLEGRTEIGRMLVTPTNPELQVNMRTGPLLAVAFADRKSPVHGIAADGLIKQFQEIVEGCIDLFDRPGASGAPPWP